MSTAEADWMFDHLTGSRAGDDRALSIKMWEARILDESDGLAALRRLTAGLDKTATLRLLEVRLWDAQLSKRQFVEVVRRIDDSLGEDLLLQVFERLQTKAGKVEVATLVQNLCGVAEDTVDFRQAAFK